jgi:hypothetical protein
MKVVERDILDKVLQELRLSTTKLIDEQSALTVGRILAARLIGIGSISGVDSQRLLTLRCIETETTRIRVVFSESLNNQKNLDVLIDKAAKEIIAKLKQEYPLRGKITSMEGEIVTVNIGGDAGVKKGLTMRVLTKQPAATAGDIGLIEVISVSPSTSQAKVVKKTGNLVTGSRVEELNEG